MKKFIGCVLVLSVLFCSCSKTSKPANDYKDLEPTGSITEASDITPTVPPKKEPEVFETQGGDPSRLEGYVNMVEKFTLEGYVNPETLTNSIAAAKDLLSKKTATQEEYDQAMDDIRYSLVHLDDGSGFISVSHLEQKETWPDAFTFFDGTKVETSEDWEKRKQEISNLYQYYMYGMARDSSLETIHYEGSESQMKIAVTVGEVTKDFTVSVAVPDSDKVSMPEGGWPVILAFGRFAQTEYANNRGYAVITLDTSQIATDDMSRNGIFYQLYPYGKKWNEQTGALMAWGWGFSKIIDALEQGAGEEYQINPANTIVTGVSRWGKAAYVAGAFDSRIRITAPSCSGAGGVAAFRYLSQGKTYDLSGVGASNQYTMTANEQLDNLQSSAERHWFNDNFTHIANNNALPFEQYQLAALCTDENRYLFIIGSYIYEDWVNAPAMWASFLAAKQMLHQVGIEDHIAMNMHKEGHAVIDEDVVYLLDYSDYHLYGKEVKSNLDDLNHSLYELDVNYDPFFDQFQY